MLPTYLNLSQCVIISAGLNIVRWPVTGSVVPTSGDWWDKETYVNDPEPNYSGDCTVLWSFDKMYDADCANYHSSNVRCVVLASTCGLCPAGAEASFMFGSD